MKNRTIFLALILTCFAFTLSVTSSAIAVEKYGIEWDPIYERIDAKEYQLPEGWKEAIAGIKDIRVFNFSAVMPWTSLPRRPPTFIPS